jgi:hypothetical protein
LLEAWKPFLGCSFSNGVFSVDGTNVKEKVPEMFIFLNLALHSFGPENVVPLVQIGKSQKCRIEENESYKMAYYT